MKSYFSDHHGHRSGSMGRRSHDRLEKIGCNMGKRLGKDDARAVDLLLDRSNVAANNGSSAFATPAGDAVVQRIGAAETVFRLLAEMPAADPPSDLIKKTMERIRERGSVTPGALEGDRPIIPQEPA
jgi:hypothetical protein